MSKKKSKPTQYFSYKLEVVGDELNTTTEVIERAVACGTVAFMMKVVLYEPPTSTESKFVQKGSRRR